MLGKLQKRLNKSDNKGFTIIEVMIVLAIAGLIMLIVFLAVPALQRSSRNTQRKSDIGRIGSAVTTVISNENGSIAGLTSTALQAEIGTLSYYTGTNVTVVGAATSTPTNSTTADTVNVYTDATCAPLVAAKGASSVGLGATSTGAANLNSVAITYSTEAGSGTFPTCTAE